MSTTETEVRKGPFATSAEAKDANWFSRRHETSEAHELARKRREEKQMAKLEGARQRQAAAALRARERLEVLDRRLGIGVGAANERARLKAKIIQ